MVASEAPDLYLILYKYSPLIKDVTRPFTTEDIGTSINHMLVMNPIKQMNSKALQIKFRLISKVKKVLLDLTI